MAGTLVNQVAHILSKEQEQVFWRLFPFLLIAVLYYLFKGG